MKIFCWLVLLLSISFASVSGDSPPNRCAFFSIMISNNTKEICRLLDQQIIYGKISSHQVPTLIPPGTSAPAFEMKQLLAGPEIITTFECGEGNKVSFSSKQTYCAAIHGHVRGHVLSSDNLKVTHTARDGSFIWNERGEISWVIDPK